ncbi:MAG TPA: hypothetical protein V6C65_26320 [Allocoleopsis sp.]
MKNLKKLIDKADEDIFSEIISGCEGKMIAPFKKEKVVIEAEPEEGEEAEESKLEDLSEEDLEKLKELYSQIKG